jgi:hypothetical protein
LFGSGEEKRAMRAIVSVDFIDSSAGLKIFDNERKIAKIAVIKFITLDSFKINHFNHSIAIGEDQMKLGRLALAGLMTMGAIAATQLVLAQQNPLAPRETQRNDRRASIARINPNRPIQIRVISQTNVPVVASVIPEVGDRVVAPGKSVTFGRLHTSYLVLPMDLQVSLERSPDPNRPLRLFLDVKTSGNEIIVGVRTSLTGAGNSSQTVDVDAQGLVYLY